MNAHILSPGPSLVNAPAVFSFFDVVIAVNRAPHTRPVYDWLVFGDDCFAHDVSEGRMPPPSIGYVCPASKIKLLPQGSVVAPWEELGMPEDLGYSANIAIWAAQTLAYAASTIHLWGFDHDGAAYSNGEAVEDPWRWERERRFFARTMALVEPGGQLIVRH